MEDKEVEYFFASDASAVIEHTNRVIYLEVAGGFLVFLLTFSHTPRDCRTMTLRPSKKEL
jgi:hypothetical protein